MASRVVDHEGFRPTPACPPSASSCASAGTAFWMGIYGVVLALSARAGIGLIGCWPWAPRARPSTPGWAAP
ncbi:MAG: hypothetical protein R3F43_11820 [bacterium]